MKSPVLKSYSVEGIFVSIDVNIKILYGWNNISPLYISSSYFVNIALLIIIDFSLIIFHIITKKSLSDEITLIFWDIP